MKPSDYLAEVRANYPVLPSGLLSAVMCTLTAEGDEDNLDENEEFRRSVAERLCTSVTPADRDFAIYLLTQEAQNQEHGWGYSDDLAWCAYPLFILGNVEDSLLIWRAKATSFDTFCGLDVQLVIGAGLERTLHYLGGLDSPDAVAAAEYIEGCRKTGDFDWMDQYREAWLQRIKNVA